MLVHQTVLPQNRRHGRHAVPELCIGRQCKPFLRHLLQPDAFRLLCVDAQLHPEGAARGRVFAHHEDVFAVVADLASLHRDPVQKRIHQADQGLHRKKQLHRRVFPEGKGKQTAQDRRQQVCQWPTQIVEDVGHFPIFPLRRSQQALTARARQREPTQADMTVFLLPHPAADPEGDELISGQQAADQMSALVQDDLCIEGDESGQDPIENLRQICTVQRTRFIHGLCQRISQHTAQHHPQQEGPCLACRELSSGSFRFRISHLVLPPYSAP